MEKWYPHSGHNVYITIHMIILYHPDYCYKHMGWKALKSTRILTVDSRTPKLSGAPLQKVPYACPCTGKAGIIGWKNGTNYGNLFVAFVATTCKKTGRLFHVEFIAILSKFFTKRDHKNPLKQLVFRCHPTAKCGASPSYKLVYIHVQTISTIDIPTIIPSQPSYKPT